jgi:hypothetical protein
MKPSHLSLALLSFSACLFAETKEAPIDLEARKASVVNLEAQIAQRESRLSELGSEIVTLDARIEKRVAELVAMLAGMSDSQDSRFRVSQIKRDAINQLRAGIERYARKRAEVKEKIRKGDASALGDLDQFDAHNLTRVEQIVELTKSFPTHRDVEKYETDGSESYWNGYYQENVRVSEEWKQNRRDGVQSGKQHNETAEELRKGIERMESLRRGLVSQLENKKLSEVSRKLAIHELGQKDAIIERLNAELQEVVMGEASPGSRQPSLEEAIDIGKLLEDASSDLRDDVSRLFRLYDVFSADRAKTAVLKENLEARKVWLQKNSTAKD